MEDAAGFWGKQYLNSQPHRFWSDVYGYWSGARLKMLAYLLP